MYSGGARYAKSSLKRLAKDKDFKDKKLGAGDRSQSDADDFGEMNRERPVEKLRGGRNAPGFQGGFSTTKAFGKGRKFLPDQAENRPRNEEPALRRRKNAINKIKNNVKANKKEK